MHVFILDHITTLMCTLVFAVNNTQISGRSCSGIVAIWTILILLIFLHFILMLNVVVSIQSIFLHLWKRPEVFYCNFAKWAVLFNRRIYYWMNWFVGRILIYCLYFFNFGMLICFFNLILHLFIIKIGRVNHLIIDFIDIFFEFYFAVIEILGLKYIP